MESSASPRFSGKLSLAALLIWFVTFVLPLQVNAEPVSRQSFDAPDAAAQALVDALKATDEKALVAILGSSLEEWIESGDPVADRNAKDDFVAAYDKKHAFEDGEAGQKTLLIGEDDFPFSIPLVKKDEKWAFDPELGKQELIDRRVGENELSTIQALLAIVDAQDEYISSNPEKKVAREYARSFISSPGKRDGLYWPADGTETTSPLGELVADAVMHGYKPTDKGGGESSLEPFNGYYFRMLKGQGPHAMGGAHSYLVNDRMIGGFGVIAWPAKYGVSGYKTFMVNQDHEVYEADLGPNTMSIVRDIQVFDPDEKWVPADLDAE